MLEALAFAKKFWPYFVIAALGFVVLFMRGDIASLKGRAEAAEIKASTLQKVNDTNAKVIEGFTAQRLANDTIIQQLLTVKTGNATRETTVRTIIEREARNDPAVRNWLNEPIPSSVQQAINAPRR